VSRIAGHLELIPVICELVFRGQTKSTLTARPPDRSCHPMLLDLLSQHGSTRGPPGLFGNIRERLLALEGKWHERARRTVPRFVFGDIDEEFVLPPKPRLTKYDIAQSKASPKGLNNYCLQIVGGKIQMPSICQDYRHGVESVSSPLEQALLLDLSASMMRIERDVGTRAVRQRAALLLGNQYSSWRRHHSYGRVCGHPAGESSHSSCRPNGVMSSRVKLLASTSTPRAVVK
jgi:hypothetical protein